MDRLEEAIQLCRAMFTQEAPTFTGRYYRIAEALNFPRPIRPTGIPILVGGPGERRTLRLVAQYADACNLFGDLDTIRHKLDVLERHCADVGRDPAEITKTKVATLVVGRTVEEARAAAEVASGNRGDMAVAFVASAVVGDADAVVEQVAAHREAGLDGLIFNLPELRHLDQVRLAGEAVTKAFA